MKYDGVELSGWLALGAGLATLAALFALYGVPTMLIFRRAGFSRWWAVLAMIPGVNYILLWWFALCRWPIEDRVEGLFAAAKHAGLLPGGKDS